MSAVHDVLLELPECGQLEVRIGHRQLFELALQYVGEYTCSFMVPEHTGKRVG